MPPKPSYLNLPPEEAIAYFRQKIAIPSENSRQFEAEMHDFAYTVASLTNAEILGDAQWLIDRAISEGISFDVFLRQFDRLIGRKGWRPDPLPAGPPDWRMRIIFETPIRRAYGAQRFKQMRSPQVMMVRKYWQWRHRDSRLPRAHHKALHNKVFRADDPFWDIAYPSCAYGCKCGVSSLSERQMRQMGLSVSTPPDPNKIAEDGFRRAPGTTPESERLEVLSRGISRLSQPLQDQVKADLREKGLWNERLDSVERADKACGDGFISDRLTCRIGQPTQDLRRLGNQDEADIQRAKSVAQRRHGKYPREIQSLRPAKAKTAPPLKIVVNSNAGDRGFFAAGNPKAIALPYRQGTTEYASIGPVHVSLSGKSPSVRANTESTSPDLSQSGRLWAVNAFRKGSNLPDGGQWQWVGGGIRTAKLRSARDLKKIREARDRDGRISRELAKKRPGTQAVLSVSQGGKGEHFYSLAFDSGNDPGLLLYTPNSPSEPRNFVGGKGRIVLGQPVGTIRTRSGEHPVYDRIQVRRSLGSPVSRSS